jgi:peptidoglycan/LPS O-acetylase OafA/YrhL
MSETTDTASKPRLLPLDLARGIAALVVAIYHFQDLGWFKYPNASPPLAVPFFFMLSGFVLSYSYGELIRSGRMRLADFVLARIARLYPLHLATLLVMGLLWLTIGAWPPAGAGPTYPLQASHFSGLQLLEGLTLTHALLGGANGFNGPSWSISIEFWCAFVVFALLLPLGTAMRLAVVAGVVGVFLISSPGRLMLVGWPPRAYTVAAVLFAVGWAIHAATPWLRPAVRRLPSPLSWLAVTAIFIGIVAPAWDVANRQMLFYGAFALIIAVLAQLEVTSTVGRWIMVRAGDWSYGIYLWHVPVLCVLAWLDGHTRTALGRGFLGYALADIVFVAAVIGISAWSYRALEVPAKLYVRNFRSRAAVPGG